MTISLYKTIDEIYDLYDGSEWTHIRAEIFIREGNPADQYDLSDDEVHRIMKQATNVHEFKRIWENENWWTDEENSSSDETS